MRHLDLFSGVGMFAYGLQKAGCETVAFAEPDKFCQRVLAKHNPGVLIYDDVREITYERLKEDWILAYAGSEYSKAVRGSDNTDAKESGARGNNERGSGAHDSRVTGASEDETYGLKEDGIISDTKHDGWNETAFGGSVSEGQAECRMQQPEGLHYSSRLFIVPSPLTPSVLYQVHHRMCLF